MIRSLTGSVVSSTEQTVVLTVQGVGYLIFTPSALSFNTDGEVTFHTHLAVRENALDLYGFLEEADLELFEHLLQLPKIGPKSALQILSQATRELIQTAVTNNDPGHLSKLSGIGKKTAEKVVAGLTEIYEKQGVVIATGAKETGGEPIEVSDTIDALVALGYPESAARKTVLEIIETKPEHTDTNSLVKQALKLLS